MCHDLPVEDHCPRVTRSGSSGNLGMPSWSHLIKKCSKPP